MGGRQWELIRYGLTAYACDWMPTATRAIPRIFLRMSFLAPTMTINIHLFSVSELFNNWCDKNKITVIEDVEKINELRVTFSQDCESDLSHDNLFTLCSNHHKQLHNIYGQRYSNHLTAKIKNWLDIQRVKNGR